MSTRRTPTPPAVTSPSTEPGVLARIGPGGPENRRSGRSPLVIEAYLRPLDPAGARIAAISVNLSRHGIALRLQQAIGVGERFELELGIGGQGVSSEVLIRRCESAADGCFEIGAEFC